MKWEMGRKKLTALSYFIYFNNISQGFTINRNKIAISFLNDDVSPPFYYIMCNTNGGKVVFGDKAVQTVAKVSQKSR